MSRRPYRDTRFRRAALLPGLLVMLAARTLAQEPTDWFTSAATGRSGCTPRDVTPIDLLTLREIGGTTGSGLSVSPDGRHVAFEAHRADMTANTYDVAWFIAETTDAGLPAYAGDGGDPEHFRNSLPSGRVVGAWVSPYAKWSPDSKGVAYRKSFDGATQVWWSNTQGGEARQLTHNAADVEDFFWSGDGSKLFFTTDASRDDLRVLRETRQKNGFRYDPGKDWSTIDGRPYFPPYELTGGDAVLWVLERRTGHERLATDEETREFEVLTDPEPKPSAGWRHSVAAGDRRGYAWLQADDPDKQGIDPPLTLYASKDTDGSHPIHCSSPVCTGMFDTNGLLRHAIHWSTVDDEILFVRKEGAAYSMRTIYAWRPGAETVRKILSTHEWVSDCSVIGDRAVCFRETPTEPRTIVSIDLDDGTLQTLVEPNPEFRCVELGRVELMEWGNAHGYKTFGYLVLPPDIERGKQYPLVFVGYRARFALRGGIGNEYPVHLLARNGFIVLVYEKPITYAARQKHSDRLELGGARWGREPFDGYMPLSSFKAAVEILSQRQIVDPARIAVTGLSNGAAHVNYAIIHSDLFAAAIASSTEFSPSGLALSGVSSDAAREYRKAIGAEAYPGPNSFAFPPLSLSLNAARVDTPLLINVSDHEHPWALAEVVALIEAGKPVEMIVYPDEGHIKWQPAHRASVYERNVDWLKFWLQGVVDDNPGKAAQYARWREFRHHRGRDER